MSRSSVRGAFLGALAAVAQFQGLQHVQQFQRRQRGVQRRGALTKSGPVASTGAVR